MFLQQGLNCISLLRCGQVFLLAIFSRIWAGNCAPHHTRTCAVPVSSRATWTAHRLTLMQEESPEIRGALCAFCDNWEDLGNLRSDVPCMLWAPWFDNYGNNESMTLVREAWVPWHDPDPSNPILSSHPSSLVQDLPPLGAAGFPREQYMALAGVRHFDLVIVFLSMQMRKCHVIRA